MRKLFVFTLLNSLRSIRNLISHSESTYKVLFIPGLAFAWRQIGKWKAWQVYELAKRNTPGYRAFLKQNRHSKIKLTGLNPDLTSVPYTDKESYVKKFPIETRCQNGILPRKGVVIDESSGTSGTPNNWVRGKDEREAIKQALKLAVHHLVGQEPYILINAFALGPWATGMNVSMSLVDEFILKSTGPDKQKIEATLNFFGPKYKYIIAGYPPFLKDLADSDKVDWSKYEIITFFGGEGISEGMRDYLLKSYSKIYGSYGASDLEINIAAENDFTIKVRKLLTENQAFAKKILKHSGLPMVFQYNPLDYYIESNDTGELIITLCRLSNIAPKVRYNIHDLGHTLTFKELLKIAKQTGVSAKSLKPYITDLPLLFHYGRADMAVAFYGCKITPGDMEEVIFQNAMLAETTSSFSLITSEDERLAKHLTIAFELKPDTKAPTKIKTVTSEIISSLQNINQDFRESFKMIPEGAMPDIVFHKNGTGPFALNDIRLKKHYIQQKND